MVKSKNNAIEFYRFFFSLIICLFHFKTYARIEPYPFSSGYMIVEFFLILSGFFLARSVFSVKRHHSLRSISKEWIGYVGGRYKRLYPHYLLSVLCLAVLRIAIIDNMTTRRWLSEGITEILMLQTVGDDYTLSIVLWFPSALFLAAIIVYTLVRIGGRFFTRAVFPVAVVGILYWLLSVNGKLDLTFSHHFLMSDGFWRALAGVMTGCVCYEITEGIKPAVAKIKDSAKTLLAVVEGALLIALVWLLYTPCSLVKDCLLLVIFAVFVILVMTGASALSAFFNKPWAGYLGRISYAIYFNHIVMYLYIFKFFPASPERPFWTVAIIYLLTVLFMSVLTTWFVGVAMRDLTALCRRIKQGVRLCLGKIRRA